MKKIKAILTILSTAAAVSLSALPVSAFYDNPIEKSCSYDYIYQKGILYSTGAFYYKNGEALKFTEKTRQYILTPAEGITLTPELLGLPGQYTLTADESTKTVRLPEYKFPEENDKMEELKVYIRKALRKGLISKAETEHCISGKCVDEPRLALKLREGTDINKFIADYPEYKLTADNTGVPVEYKDYQLFSRAAEKGENIDEFYEIINLDKAVVKVFGMESKRRVEECRAFIKTCDDIHSIYKREPFDEEYSYFEDPENIIWTKDICEGKNTDTVALYKNGKFYTNLKKKLRITFMTTDDYRNSSDLPDLPDNLDVYNPEWRDDEMSLERQIDVNTIKELDKAAELVKSWAEKGIATEPKIWRHYSYKDKLTFYVSITLKSTEDFETVLNDYPDFALYDSNFYNADKALTEVTPDNYTGDRQSFILLLPDDKYSEVWDIEKELQTDSRIQEAEIHTASGQSVSFDDDEMIEYTASETLPSEPVHITKPSEPSDASAYTPAASDAIAPSAIPVSASEGYDYIDNPENIAWEETYDNGQNIYRTAVYKNGNVYPNIHKILWISFNTTDDYRNNSDFTDLPEKYNIENIDWVNNEMSLERIIAANTQEELEEIAGLAGGWAEKGFITDPVINRVYRYSENGSLHIKTELENPDDLESFIADYPEYELYDNNINKLTFKLKKEQNINAREIEKILKSDSRVKKAEIIASYSDTSAEVSDIPKLIEHKTISEDIASGTYIRGDISGNSKIDLYDAIEIAKSIIGVRKLTSEEMAVADYNGDGKVDIYDAIEIAKKIITV